jgi:nicotinamidase/pyrazinamidase
MTREPRRTAILIVDVQTDFCPGGALPVPEGDRVVPVLNRVLAKLAGAPVYASRDWHPPDTTHFKAFGGRWPVHCVAGTRGADLHRDLHLPHDTVIVSKGQDRADDGYSAFEGTTAGGRTLADDLRARGVTHLVVGGLATDYCVRASVLDARRHGFDATVITDAVAGIGAEDSATALEEMQQAGARRAASDEIGNG